MATTDARVSAWDLRATAGTTRSLEFTNSEALASLSVYVGGTVSDVDDLVGATEHVAVLSGGNLVATVDVPVPDATVKSTPLRLVVNGVVQTVGVLIPTSRGSESPGSTVPLTAGSLSFDLAVLGASPVKSVAGRTGDVVLAKADVGLANVDNTADLAKPVSTAAQTALDAKAPLASPTFTGTPTAPTPAAGDNTTKVATTAFVQTEVANGTSGAGLLADRPAASADNAGHLYFATDVDGGTLYRSTGSSWVQTAAGVAFGTSGRKFIQASAFRPGASAASLADVGTSTLATTVMQFDPVTSEYASVTAIMPFVAATINVDLYWLVSGVEAAAGVVWRLDYHPITDGVSVNAETTHTAGTVAVTTAAQYVPKVTRLAAGIALADVARLQVNRLAGNAADTFTGDAGMVGVLVSRAS